MYFFEYYKRQCFCVVNNVCFVMMYLYMDIYYIENIIVYKIYISYEVYLL